MRLGIPGSTATVFPDHARGRGTTWGGEGEDHGRAAAGSSATATVHMAQHFMQP